jgi:hypothetical protein
MRRQWQSTTIKALPRWLFLANDTDLMCYVLRFYLSLIWVWCLQAGEQDVEEEDVSDGSGRSNKSEVQEDEAEEVIFDLLCKLFGFLVCGIGNVRDIRHLVQCLIAQ